MPTNQQAFKKAKQKIDQARRDGATELDLSCEYGAEDSEKLTELPEWLGQLTQLQALDLGGNQLTALPEWLGQLTQLQTLDVRSNQLTTLPESLGQLTQLQTLNLQSNQLTALPESLGQLTQLQTLSLERNQLTALPESLGRLTQLLRLEIYQNRLTTLPDSLGELQKLTFLALSNGVDNGNPIGQLPQCMSRLTKLQTLWIQGCGLQTIPAWIAELSDLSRLVAQKNQISELPTSLGELTNLEISLEQNPLNPELAAAYEQGLDAVREYLRAKAEDQIVLNEAKLILIGEGEVGKTSLLGALRGDEWVENRPTTHGVEVDIKSLVLDVPPYDGLPRPSEALDSGDSTALEGHRTGSEPKQITFNAWDFGGQDIYKHTHQLFFTAPAIYLAVWDPRGGPEKCRVEDWIKLVKHRAYDENRHDDRPRIIVVATRGGPIDRLAHIDEETIREQFGDMIVGFHHVDSRPDDATGERKGIEELKQTIAATAVSIRQVGRTVPTSWKDVLEALRKRSEKDLCMASF